MTKDDIIRMAKEAAARHGHTFKEKPNDAVLEIIAETYAMGAAAEREACAGLRKEIVLIGDPQTEYEEGFWDALQKYEDAIRARSES